MEQQKLFEKIREEQRIRILNSAKKLILEKGISETTMKDIACECGISRPALYKYFKNFHEVIFTLIPYTFNQLDRLLVKYNAENELEELIYFIEDMFKAPSYQRDNLVLIGIFDAYYSNLKATESMMINYEKNFLVYNDSYIIRLIKQGQSSGCIRKDVNANIAGQSIHELFFSFVIRITILETHPFRNIDRIPEIKSECLNMVRRYLQE